VTFNKKDYSITEQQGDLQTTFHRDGTKVEFDARARTETRYNKDGHETDILKNGKVETQLTYHGNKILSVTDHSGYWVRDPNSETFTKYKGPIVGAGPLESDSNPPTTRVDEPTTDRHGLFRWQPKPAYEAPLQKPVQASVEPMLTEPDIVVRVPPGMKER
jgi:hypothetical protein